MKTKLKIGTRVKIVNLSDDVQDEVKEYEGATGYVKSYGSPSRDGLAGYYIRMDDGRHAKRFFENELEVQS